jgi:hypothetical protein
MTKNQITNTRKQVAEEPALGIIIGSVPYAIEAQEARGQRELVNAAVLPTRGMEQERAAWEAMGIKIGSPVTGDDLFTNVELPDGWLKRSTDHAMWSELIDNKGRVRGKMFYKAAFYDRDASISVVRRFEVGRDYDRDDFRSTIVVRVTDCGKVVFESQPVAVSPKDWAAVGRAEKLGIEVCELWLANNGYSDYRNPAAYWD